VIVRRLGLRFVLLAGAGLFATAACAVEDYKFVDSAPTPPQNQNHCDNDLLEPELGETDLDCGGLYCRGCELGQNCIASTDCVEGDCIDGTCQQPGCSNGAQDAGETDLNCGGPCDPCQVGQNCLQNSDCQSDVCDGNLCAQPACDDDTLNGEETAKDCGGPRCDGCDPGEHCELATDCKSGLCDEATELCLVRCVEGTGECDGNYAVECETNLLITAEHCGECRSACDLAHATASCAGGECQVESCEAPWDRCNTDDADGCETNLSEDAENCGGCGNACSDDHGEPYCEDSECQIDCEEDYDDCNDSRVDGCETHLARDVKNCGECRRVCEGEDGEEPFCDENGECGSSDCEEGFGNCEANPDGLCLQDLRSDVRNCGHCGGLCTVQNGTPGCDDRVCVVDDCNGGFDNCNADDADGGFADGCETNLQDDENNCGECGNVCAAENGSAACVDGECRIESCGAGFDNCNDGDDDGGYADGCETNTATDKQNCGGCGDMGIDCDDAFAPLNATGRCLASTCQIADCFDDFGDCDDNTNNGCESDLRSDEGDCGACDRECMAIGTTGSPGNECVARACVPSCDANHLNCDTLGPNGCEVDRRSDEENCGTCGNECVSAGGTNNCTNGACVPGCDATHLNCNGDADDGCETLCSNAGTASRTCNGAACSVTCDSTHLTCDSNQANGCETLRSITNCGACNQVCADTNADDVACTNGVCDPSCLPGFGACADPEDGCTTRLDADPFCGSCTGDCGGDTGFCVATGGEYRCQAQITLANQAGGSTTGATLNFTHALQSGANRLILLAVAAESGGNGVTGAQPNSVTYGGTNMTAGPVQAGSSQTSDPGYWSPDLFIYYLTEAGLSGKSGNQTVTVDGSAGATDPSVVGAYLIELTGVRQTNPITAQAGGTMLAQATPGSISHGVAVTTAGSRVFSVAAALWAPAPTVAVSPSGQSLTQLTAIPEVDSGTRMRVSALYISGMSASNLAPATYTPTWSYANPHSRTHLAVVVNPLQMP
jgi:hypothetical protein